MTKKRIIPCLDISGGRTVKGVNFVNLRDAGDPVELAKHYSDSGADELVFLDISATQEKRQTLVALVKKVAAVIDIPLTVGGGISSLEQAQTLLDSGADKVSISSAAVREPELINELSLAVGSKRITVAIDAKKIGDKWRVFLMGGKRQTELELLTWAKEMERRGAGEILFTSMDHDGTKNGFPCDILAELSSAVSIPIIASGGAGKSSDFLEVFTHGKADAALAASVFHFGDINIQELKKSLQESGVLVEL